MIDQLMNAWRPAWAFLVNGFHEISAHPVPYLLAFGLYLAIVAGLKRKGRP